MERRTASPQEQQQVRAALGGARRTAAPSATVPAATPVEPSASSIAAAALSLAINAAAANSYSAAAPAQQPAAAPRRVHYSHAEGGNFAAELPGFAHDAMIDISPSADDAAGATFDLGHAPSSGDRSSGPDGSDAEDAANSLEHDAMSSAGSSNGSGTARTTRSTSRVCGCTSNIWHAIAVACIIAFLIAYQAISLTREVTELNLLTKLKTDGVFDAVLETGTALAAERRDTSQWLASVPGSTINPALSASLLALRGNASRHLKFLSNYMLSSDLETRAVINDEISTLESYYSALRARADARLVSSPTFRKMTLHTVDKVYRIMLHIAEDSRLSSTKGPMLNFYVLRRMVNAIGLQRATGVALLSEGQDTFLENQKMINALAVGIERDTNTLTASASDDVRAQISTWLAEANTKQFNANFEMLSNMTSAADKPPSLTLEAWLKHANGAADSLHESNLRALDALLGGDNQRSVALAEGLKMLFAVLTAVVVTSFVMWLNTTEQAALRVSLTKARALTRAVKRFVPQSSLRMLGLRTLTEVREGMSVELHQVMFFSDLRDFSVTSEKLSNVELFAWLQRYINLMSSIVARHNGTIVNIIGDAVFATHANPKDALKSALTQQATVDAINSEMIAVEGKEDLVAIGCGLHAGVVVCGVFGDSSRMQVTLVASDVNLAARLESLTKAVGAKIICSEAVIDQLQDPAAFALRKLGTVQVSGSGKQIRVRELFQADSLPLKQHKMATRARFEEAIALQQAAEAIVVAAPPPPSSAAAAPESPNSSNVLPNGIGPGDDDGAAAAERTQLLAEAQRIFAEVAGLARLAGVRDGAAETRAKHVSNALQMRRSDSFAGSTRSAAMAFKKNEDGDQDLVGPPAASDAAALEHSFLFVPQRQTAEGSQQRRASVLRFDSAGGSANLDTLGAAPPHTVSEWVKRVDGAGGVEGGQSSPSKD